MATKYKGTIIACGYYSLNSAIVELVKQGWRVVTLHRMENPVLDGLVVNESKGLTDLHNAMLRGIETETDDVSILTGERLTTRTVSGAEYQILACLGIGGKQFAHADAFLGITAARLGSNLVVINAAHRYFRKLVKKYKDVKAVLIHTAEGGTYRSIVESARLIGIPTFCSYNGTISGTSTRFAAHGLYTQADTYYLHGQYDINYIKSRELIDGEITYPMVGQPSFDPYYKGGKIKIQETDPNSFLYCVTVVCGVYHLPNVDMEATIQMIDFAMFTKVFPPNNDGMFFAGFSHYQNNVNPDAKLAVSLRPYYNLRDDDFKRYVESFGIKNVTVHDHHKVPARELIPKNRYLISSESTILIEGLLNRRGIVYLLGCDGGVGHRFEGTEEWTKGAATDDPKDISNAITEATEDYENLVDATNAWAPHYNYKDDGKAGKRLAKDLDRRLS